VRIKRSAAIRLGEGFVNPFEPFGLVDIARALTPSGDFSDAGGRPAGRVILY
jgi:hypothetical protein